MANSIHLIGLLVWWILLCNFFVSNNQFLGRRLAEASKRRDFIHREGTIKTIKSGIGDGDVVDCVDLYKQPAFHHPSLRNHQIQMMPSSYPRGWEAHSSTPKHTHIQPWSENKGCPDGTIPILRTPAYNYEHMRIKPSKLSNSQYEGVSATLNIWNPWTSTNELSASQIWIRSNFSGDHDKFSSIEAGWMVNPGKYYGTHTRFFILWTNNGFESYCYDLDCPGFVQIDKSYALGAVLRTSSFGGEQQTIDIKIFKDEVTKVWWLRVQDVLLGYWPAELFPDLLRGANTVQWGGQIYNTFVAGHHTVTRMGRGLFPGEGYREASYMSQLLYVNSTYYVVDPEELVQIVSKPACYNLGLHIQHGTPQKGVYFFYGGPGFSAECL